jgi:hypothetical protein
VHVFQAGLRLPGVLCSGAWWEEGSAVDERASTMRTGAGSWGVGGRLFLGRKVETEGEMDEGGDPGE